MTFELGQIFEKQYPIECAKWCNEHGYFIQEIEPLENGTRQFQICAPKEKTLDEQTLEELEQQENTLNAQVAQLKDQFLTATLAEDTEQVAAIKAEYQNLVGV